MRHRNIFVSRWMALLWAAGIIWFALDVSSTGETTPAGNGQREATDVTGAPVSNDQVRQLEETIANL